MENFATIKEEVYVEIVEKKSKFIAHLFPVENVEEAENIIKETKKKYYDARHNCIAYRIVDKSKVIEKASDDGEPSGTAGGPMLNILQKNNLANILVIVTRYFGGILLGTGGLVRAYSDSLIKAIELSTKVEKCLGTELNVYIKYTYYETFKHYCKKNNINIVDSQYLENIVCKIQVTNNIKEKIIKDFEIKNINLEKMEFLSEKYINKV